MGIRISGVTIPVSSRVKMTVVKTQTELGDLLDTENVTTLTDLKVVSTDYVQYSTGFGTTIITNLNPLPATSVSDITYYDTNLGSGATTSLTDLKVYPKEN